MGFKDSGPVNDALRKMWPELFFTTDDEIPAYMSKVDCTIADFLGIVRAFETAIQAQDPLLPEHVIIANSKKADDVYFQALASREQLLEANPDIDPATVAFPKRPIVLWGQFKDALGRICKRILHNLDSKDFIVCCDHLGMLPPAKTIVYREKRYLKPAQPLIEKAENGMFSDESPIYNKFYDIFADKTSNARRRLLMYLTNYFVTEFPYTDAIPPGKRFIYHGGIGADGKLHELPVSFEHIGISVGDATKFEIRKTDYACNPPIFRGEADLCINSWVLHYPVTHNILILSKDGDLLLSSLAIIRDRWREATDLNKVGSIYIRRFKSVRRPIAQSDDSFSTTTTEEIGGGEDEEEEETEGGDEESYYGKRKRGAPKDYRNTNIPEYIDVKGLFIRIWALFYKMQQQGGFQEEQMCDPIELFITLCYMRGNDYTDGLCGVGFKKLYTAFAKGVETIGPLLRSELASDIAPGLNERHRVINYHIDYANFVQLVILAYSERWNLNKEKYLSPVVVDNANSDERIIFADEALIQTKEVILQELKRRKDKTRSKKAKMEGKEAPGPSANTLKQMPPDPSQLRQFIAALVRTIGYYTQGGKAGYDLVNDLATDKDGYSLHGYSENAESGLIERAGNVAIKAIY